MAGVSAIESVSRIKPAFCICENKDADQLRSNCATDQRLCFRYMDSAISLLSKAEMSSLQPSSVAVQPGLCQTLSETPKTGFLTTRLIFFGRVASSSSCLELSAPFAYGRSCEFRFVLFLQK